MNTCNSCKYWGGVNGFLESDDWANKGLKLKKCHKATMFFDSTEWDNDIESYTYGEARRIKTEFKDNKAFTIDGSDYKADLITMGDFACNQWKDSNNEHK